MWLAVDGVSFAVRAGETLGLVGESGSGKSVTSLAVMRLLAAGAVVEGSIRLRGTELLAMPERAMRGLRGRELAMVFQEPMTALNPVMSVGEQVAEAVRAHAAGAGPGRGAGARVAALDEVALPSRRSGTGTIRTSSAVGSGSAF